MTPAQVAHIMSLVEQAMQIAREGQYDPSPAYAAVEAALRDAPQANRPLTTRELAEVTTPWANVWTDVSFGIANAAVEKFCEVNGVTLAAKPTPKFINEEEAINHYLLTRTPSAPTAVEPDERTPQDYAIEHAEYMAQSAAHLIACVNDLALSEQQCEDGEANPSDVDAARESLTEAQGHLKSSIYEFRKRRDRASKGTP